MAIAVHETINQRIKRIRKARGFSQEALALAAGLPRPVLSGIECGRAKGENVTVGTIMKLAWALGVSIDMLVGVREM